MIKATLMAGASRITHNTSTSDIADYRCPANRSDNGLDLRYGAGQLNIDHSYRIITAGEQYSLEDLPSPEGLIADRGFDYDPLFGGSDGTPDGTEVLAGTSPLDPSDYPEQLTAATSAMIIYLMVALSITGAFGLLRRS